MNDVAQIRTLVRQSQSIAFTGKRRDFFRLVCRGALLELITAGFYRFWLATDIRRSLWSGTLVDGHAREYTGTAKELLKRLSVCARNPDAGLSPIFPHWHRGRARQGLCQHSAGSFLLCLWPVRDLPRRALSRYAQGLARSPLLDVRFGLGLFHGAPVCGSLLVLLTLGLALPWRESALERYKMRHLHYGDLPARFEGTASALFKRGWWLWLLSLPIITLPFTYPAYKAVL